MSEQLVCPTNYSKQITAYDIWIQLKNLGSSKVSNSWFSLGSSVGGPLCFEGGGGQLVDHDLLWGRVQVSWGVSSCLLNQQIFFPLWNPPSVSEVCMVPALWTVATSKPRNGDHLANPGENHCSKAVGKEPLVSTIGAIFHSLDHKAGCSHLAAPKRTVQQLMHGYRIWWNWFS